MAVAAALVLAAVLAWAAVAKLRRRERVVASFEGLGLPVPPVLAVAVPAVEAGLSICLVLAPRVASWPALGLLVVFTGVIVRALARREGLACACFGASSASRPLSARDVIRNGVLAALAVLATAAPPGLVL